MRQVNRWALIALDDISIKTPTSQREIQKKNGTDWRRYRYKYVCMAIYMNSIRREVMCIWNSSNSQ